MVMTQENAIFIVQIPKIKITETPVNCSNAEITDTNLKSDTTYFYKAQVADTVSYSDILEVKTLGQKAVSIEEVENPKTGLISPIVLLPLPILFSLFLILVKKKSLFKSI